MKIIKITAIWCSGCLVMNKRFKNIMKTKIIDVISLDYDMDSNEIQKYNPGNILPVFIFINQGKEIKRINGEISEQKLLELIEELEDVEEDQ